MRTQFFSRGRRVESAVVRPSGLKPVFCSMSQEQIIILDDNLFFASAISGQLEKSGIKFKSLSSQTDLNLQFLKSAALAIVNLNATRFDPLAIIDWLKQIAELKILGFGGHGQTDLIERGKKAGCNWVIPNSVVAKRLVHFLKQQNLLSCLSAASTQKP